MERLAERYADKINRCYPALIEKLWPAPCHRFIMHQASPIGFMRRQFAFLIIFSRNAAFGHSPGRKPWVGMIHNPQAL